EDRIAIRELIENWAVWRDAGMWEQFKTVWHDGAQMTATWFAGPATEFIERSRESFARGARAQHFLGGIAMDLNGTRAVAQTKMTIGVRASVEGVVCDILSSGRFYDLLEKRAGRWGIVERRAIYEKDRLDPVDTGAVPKLDQTLLNSFPLGYRHLAYHL